MAMLFVSVVYSQTKKNGTIYKEHPAIAVVEGFQKAFVAGDTAMVASYLTDNYKSYNGSSTNPEDKGTDKKATIGSVQFWKDNVAYFSMERSQGAYPDALEYKDGTNDDVVWVQTWDNLKGVHKGTGTKIDMPIHRLYVVNKDNKITRMFNYGNDAVFQSLRASFSTRKNGVVYDEHANINTVKKMVRALEHGDSDLGFSYFTDDAKFSNLDMPIGETTSLTDEKANFNKFLEDWDLVSIDMVGYPDYLEYERANAKVVQSWWNLKVKKKSDDNIITVPVMLIHDFNDEGKITNEAGYYTMAALMK